MRRKNCLFCSFFFTVPISLSSGQQERAEESGLLFPISKLGMWGYINKAGEIVIEAQFKFALAFSEGLAVVMVGEGKCRFGERCEF